MSTDLSTACYQRCDTAVPAGDRSEFEGGGCGSRDFSRQYYRIYSVRLAAARDGLQTAAEKRWGCSLPLVPLHQLCEESECAVIGTLFKRQELRPSILQEVSEEHSLQPTVRPLRFTAADDSLVLEDELARVRLDGDIDPHSHVTGVVCALRGRLLDTGRFLVSDVCYRALKVGPELPMKTAGPGRLVLLVSGLGVGSGDMCRLQLLCDLVAGHVGGERLQEKMSRLACVIIAGNSLHTDTSDRDSMKQPSSFSSHSTDRSVEAFQLLDQILGQLVACCDVQLMPGEHDPSSHMWPQRAFHRCLLPASSAFSTLQRVGNPHSTRVAGCVMTGSAGQNVSDLGRFSSAEDPLVALRRLLQWSHLCPSAPDTLACQPFSERDPFLLDSCPHVLFAGNQPLYGSELCSLELQDGSSQQVRLISVPSFSATGSAALLDTSTLHVEQISIGVELS